MRMTAVMTHANKVVLAGLLFSICVLFVGPYIWPINGEGQTPQIVSWLVGLAMLIAWLFSIVAIVSLVIGLTLYSSGCIREFWVSIYTLNAGIVVAVVLLSAL